MSRLAAQRMARIEAVRADSKATGITSTVTSGPKGEVGKHVYTRVTEADLPVLRALVNYLESGTTLPPERGSLAAMIAICAECHALVLKEDLPWHAAWHDGLLERVDGTEAG